MSKKPKTSTRSLFRGIVLGDPHIKDACPIGRTEETWSRELESVVSEVLSLGEVLQADFIATTGDWMHSKDAGHPDVLRGIRAFRPLVDRFGPILGILGNHDMTGSNIGDSGRRAISVLVEAGIVKLVDLDPWYCEKDGKKLCVCGVSHRPHGMAGSYGKIVNNIPHGEADAILALTHQDVPKGMTHIEESMVNVFANRMMFASGKKHSLAVANGHIHDNVTARHYQNGLFVGLGCLGRVSRAEKDINPVAGVLTWSPTAKPEWDANLIPLSSCAGSEGFLSGDGSLVDLSNSEALEKFLAYLKDQGGDEIEDPLATLREFAKDNPSDHVQAAEAILRETV